MEWLFKNAIAHRGLHSETSCENSLNAFAKAVENGYAIELDVQQTSCGEIVVFHDFNTFRLTNKDLEIDKSTYEELKTLTLLNTNERIPLLKEVFELVRGKVPLIIEIKNNIFDGRIEAHLSQLLEEYEGAYAVCSFDYKSMAWFKANRPYICRGLIFGENRKLGLRDFFNFIYCFDATTPNFISLHYAHINSKIVRFCKVIKMPLIIWTVDSAEKKKKALSVAHNIIFEGIEP